MPSKYQNQVTSVISRNINRELDNELSFKQSQAINLSINSDIPIPGFLYPEMFLIGGPSVTILSNLIIKDYLFIIIKAAIFFCFDIFLFMLFYIPDPEKLILQSFK